MDEAGASWRTSYTDFRVRNVRGNMLELAGSAKFEFRTRGAAIVLWGPPDNVSGVILTASPPYLPWNEFHQLADGILPKWPAVDRRAWLDQVSSGIVAERFVATRRGNILLSYEQHAYDGVAVTTSQRTIRMRACP